MILTQSRGLSELFFVYVYLICYSSLHLLYAGPVVSKPSPLGHSIQFDKDRSISRTNAGRAIT